MARRADCRGASAASASLLLLAVAVSASLALAQQPANGAAAPRTEFSSSIVLAVPTDYLLDGSGSSKCMQMVERAARDGGRRLQFVPTIFWVDEGPLDPPPGFDGSCKGQVFLESYYCYNRFNATRVKHFCYDRASCAGPPQRSDIDRFRSSLQACMQLATSKGLDLSVNMHVDDATRSGLGGWRNTLNFSPVEKYSGVSYVEAVLDPIADAVAAAMRPGTQAWITMQGEMGASVFFHPDEWAQVADGLRRRIGGGAKIGVGINNAKLCGCILVPIVDQREFLAKFPAAFEAVKGEFDLPAIQSFFWQSIDFVGLSAYIPQASTRFQPCDLEGLMSRLDQEFQAYGLTLKELQAAGKELHWLEFGVGGGTSPRGDSKATTAEEAAFTPFFGMSGPYTRAKDPFLLWDLGRPSPVRDYARYFYNQTAAYLAQGGCEYRVDHLYVWSLESWDVQGVYPISTTSEGSYRDPAIASLIQAHNRGERGP